MSEQVLTVLKFCLLAILYLFLARVVWVVARELRGTPIVAPPVAGAAPGGAPQRSRRRWRLVLQGSTPDAGRELWVDGDVTIGRGAGCTLSIPGDTFVSTVHARVYARDGQLWVEDAGSTNGTFVNGKRVSGATRVRKGDRIQVGETVFEAQS